MLQVIIDRLKPPALTCLKVEFWMTLDMNKGFKYPDACFHKFCLRHFTVVKFNLYKSIVIPPSNAFFSVGPSLDTKQWRKQNLPFTIEILLGTAITPKRNDLYSHQRSRTRLEVLVRPWRLTGRKFLHSKHNNEENKMFKSQSCFKMIWNNAEDELILSCSF